MKNILLLSAPFVPYYMRNARCDFVSLSKTQWYPIILGYCGAFLESKGYKTTLIDAPAYNYNHEKTFNLISAGNYDYVVLYSGLLSEDNDIAFAEKIIRELKIPVVFVGPFASVDPKRILNKSKLIDKVVVSEMELPVLELLQNKDYGSIQNLVYRDNGTIKENPIRHYYDQKFLDSIPFLSKYFKEHIDPKYYKTPSEYYPYTDIFTGRGCVWGHCTYCLWVHSYIKGNTYNKRSIQNVVEEFEYIKKEMPNIRSVMIQDDTFTEDRAKELSLQLIEKNIKLPWSCYARPNMSLEVLQLMKKAGCRNLHVGFESFNPVVLKNIKKGVTRETMIKFAQDANKAGMQIHADIAAGFEGDTKEGFLDTVRTIIKINPHTVQFQLMIPFEGTPFYDNLKKEGWLKERGPNYPNFSNDEIRKMAKKAYRMFYFNWRYFVKIIKNPYEYLFGRLDTIFAALPNLFWKKW